MASQLEPATPSDSSPEITRSLTGPTTLLISASAAVNPQPFCIFLRRSDFWRDSIQKSPHHQRALHPQHMGDDAYSEEQRSSRTRYARRSLSRSRSPPRRGSVLQKFSFSTTCGAVLMKNARRVSQADWQPLSRPADTETEVEAIRPAAILTPPTLDPLATTTCPPPTLQTLAHHLEDRAAVVRPSIPTAGP